MKVFMTSKPKLLIVTYGHAKRQARVYVQAYYLRENFDVTVLSLGNPELEGVAFEQLHRKGNNLVAKAWQGINLLFGSYGPAIDRYGVDLSLYEKQFDLLLVHDLEPLPMSFKIAKGAPIVLDAHEYFPVQFNESFAWRLFFKRYLIDLCKQYIPRCAAMTTVCDTLADKYGQDFGIRPEVVFSGPVKEELTPSPVDDEHIAIVAHGAAKPNRQTEKMIYMMDHTDKRFTLSLYLVGDAKYLQFLKGLADKRDNVIWEQPVKTPELSSKTNKYDLGLYIIEPSTENALYCLPNKFFEYIQARLGIAIAPSPEMAKITHRHELGVVADDFTSENLAAKLNALTADDVRRFKANAHLAAELYNAKASMEKMKSVLMGALSGNNA